MNDGVCVPHQSYPEHPTTVNTVCVIYGQHRRRRQCFLQSFKCCCEGINVQRVTPQLTNISGLLHFTLPCVRAVDADFEDVTQEDHLTLGDFIVAHRVPESAMNMVYLTFSSVSGICQTHM